ncbi:mannose-6-phosphate isomerase, class I [Clostridium sp.]|uniref:mannose-6-phosphate isomerase, class I n=1 Tax=Clostridium sp. TaxID=1506 RepID=UPI0039911613
MYPIKFKSLYYDKVWGGRDLENFRSDIPEGNIGESWDIACHNNGTGIVENGEFKGMSFKELLEKYGDEIMGNYNKEEKFPLLVKLINSKEKLSVQVHPGDEYAKINEGDNGKTEAWYVIDAKEGANLIVGTKNCTKEEFENAIKNNEVEKYLNKIEVKKGDCFLINSGLVHAICEGVIIAEIQQNSDVTYRVYDYGRPREIHVKKALDVIDLNLKAENLKERESLGDVTKGLLLCENEYFGIIKYKINDEIDLEENERFAIITVVDGEGVIVGKDYKETLKKGDSYLIPANIGQYKIQGNITFLKSYAV